MSLSHLGGTVYMFEYGTSLVFLVRPILVLITAEARGFGRVVFRSVFSPRQVAGQRSS